MKLEVGMYVRTRYGIAKVTNLSETIGSRGFYIDREIMDCNEENWKSFCTIHDVMGEPSFDIIDLIEVGDYVNGKLVVDKWEEPFGEFVGQIFIELDGEKTIPTMRKIETIVTKEQFEYMQYKVVK